MRPHFSGKRRKPAPAEGYSPGHFLALVRKHNWPPMFTPTPIEPVKTKPPAYESRERAMANGSFYATGTIQMGGTPKHQRAPGWMKGTA